ncbi:MAG: hypothetical protein ACYC61_24425 [Isosphaeraceae bacterium]
MSGFVAYRVFRGLAYRAYWVFLYLAYLATALVAFLLLIGALVVIIDPGGLRSGRARHDVAIRHRVTAAVAYGSVGLLAAAGAQKLRDYHRRINPLYPEMRVSFRAARPEDWSRASEGSMVMYDRELDGGL